MKIFKPCCSAKFSYFDAHIKAKKGQFKLRVGPNAIFCLSISRVFLVKYILSGKPMRRRGGVLVCSQLHYV